ncbi:MAG: hypothetical protein GF383_12490 [Candidatus Lokiarchaeota archaeon]|nr:hypothetical protein [Candidatus Lokiarchaeota archaeon]MBD3341828.1 hypothetical protein [Candidatus Lokiarchaeota archaeon]
MIKTETTNSINVVIIKVKNEKYLFEVKDVKEIYVPGQNVISVPLANREIVGIIDIRGEIYSIISLRRYIYSDENLHELNDKSRIILLEFKGLNLAILVDSVIGVKRVPLSMFQEKSTIVETNVDYELIKSVGVLDDETYILLDLKSLIAQMNIDLDNIQTSLPYSRPDFTSLPEQKLTKKIGTQVKPIPKYKTQELLTGERINLTPQQEDLLREIGNIGTGNAITALSRLIKKKIEVSLTNVGIISFDNLPNQFGGPQEKVCGIFSQIKENSNSTIFQAFEMKPLMRLISTLTGGKSKIDPDKVDSKKDLDNFAVSTITEMGNILAGHYASALADLIGTKMMVDVPEFALTEVGSLGKFFGQELETISEYIVLIKTSIKITDLELNGVFFFIPDLDTLYEIFDRLGIAYNGSLPDKRKKSPITRAIDLKQLTLSEIQRDALQEVGNIGAGNAANALAQMINKKVTIDIPSVEMVELDKYASKISKNNTTLFVAWSNVTGKTRATILSIFKMPDIVQLASILVNDRKKISSAKIKSLKDFPEIYISAISELGHILASHYASALGDLLDIRLMTEPPDMSIDKGNQLFNILQDEIGLLKKLSLVITTSVIITDIKITGTFLYIPDINTLKELLAALEKFYG